MRKLTHEEFIEKSVEIHGNKYNYSLCNYINNQIKIKIICQIHGEFEQTPMSHLAGKGCFKCSKSYKLSNEDFIIKSKQIYKNKFTYEKCNYTGSKNPVLITCKIHGDFTQIAGNHLKHNGCCYCTRHNLTHEEFILRAKEIHGDIYDYSLIKFINSNLKIKVICKLHGLFEKRAYNLICNNEGSGCPICRESLGERKIRNFLNKNNIVFEREYKFTNCRYKRQLPFDFYLNDKNICIEYDGILHFTSIKYFKNNVDIIKKKDSIKTKYCLDNGIKLIRIKYTDYDNIESILEKELLLIKDIDLSLNKESVSNTTHADSVTQGNKP